MSAAPRKFKRGRVVRSLSAAARLVERGEWLFMHHKPQHPRVIECMTMGTIRAFAARGFLRHAVRIDQ